MCYWLIDTGKLIIYFIILHNSFVSAIHCRRVPYFACAGVQNLYKQLLL